MDNDTGASVVETMDSSIFFYGAVTTEAAMELNRILTELDIRVQSAGATYGQNGGYIPTINLHIMTHGGSLMTAFSVVDTMRRLKSRVHTYAEGGVASAGTLIICAGDRRFIGKNAYMLIHQLEASMEGKFAELSDTMENSQKFMTHIHEFYEEHTNLKGDDLTQILRREIWLDADTCLKLGLVDEIY